MNEKEWKKTLDNSEKKLRNIKGDDPPRKKLTPWQKKHQEFMNAKGKMTSWQLEATERKKQQQRTDHLKLLVNDADQKKQVNQQGSPKINGQAGAVAPRVEYEPFQLQLPKLRKLHNFKLYRRLAMISISFMIGILLMLYLISPFSKLQTIKVVGEDHLSSSQIVQTSGFELGANIWTQWLQKRNCVKNLEKMSARVKNTQVNLTKYNEITVSIQEYPEVLYEFNNKNHKLYPILANGQKIKKPLQQESDNLPILHDFKNKQQLEQVVGEVHKIDDEIKREIISITMTPSSNNPDLILLKMRDENEVKVSLEDLGTQINNYPEIAKQMAEPGVIDMEVGVFSYPFSQKEEEEHDQRSSPKKDQHKKQ